MTNHLNKRWLKVKFIKIGNKLINLDLIGMIEIACNGEAADVYISGVRDPIRIYSDVDKLVDILLTCAVSLQTSVHRAINLNG